MLVTRAAPSEYPRAGRRPSHNTARTRPPTRAADTARTTGSTMTCAHPNLAIATPRRAARAARVAPGGGHRASSTRGGPRGRRPAANPAATSADVAFVTTAEVPAAHVEPYRPSPMDSSLLVPQLVGIAFLAVAVGYVQVVLNPTARVKFDARDEDKRAYVKELMASEDEPGDDRGLERWYYRNVLLRGGMRPRGDQTRGGTVVPGLEQRKGGKGEGTEGE